MSNSTSDSLYTLRVAKRKDARTLAQIGAATFLESFVEEIDGEAIINHCEEQHAAGVYEKYLSYRKTRAWIAEFNKTGVPIGYALNCLPDLPVEPQPGDIELKRIYVFSRFHGSGAGKALMQASIDHARELGASRLLLGTYEGNGRAIGFYKKVGFETIGTRQFLVGGTYYDDIVMGLDLT